MNPPDRCQNRRSFEFFAMTRTGKPTRLFVGARSKRRLSRATPTPRSACVHLLDRGVWTVLSCRLDVFANDSRVARRNTKEGNRRSFWMAASLLPVAECMHADPHSLGKSRLRQPDESSQRGYVFP